MTLESIATSTLPDSINWEVLVVDNNSRDRTCQVVEDFRRRYPGRFRYLFEPRQGKSHALNTGVREAHGAILAFMDDDVLVEPTCLLNLTSTLHCGEWAGAGGRILPARDFLPPRWMSLNGPYSLAGPLCGTFDLGEIRRELDRPPHGANMAFRKDMFEKYGGFRIDLGPPPRKVQGEDTEFCQRLMRAGERLRYEPSAIVRHPVLEYRLRKKYFLTWMFKHGRAVIRLRESRPPVWGIPRNYLGIANRIGHLLPVCALRWVGAVDPKGRFWHKCWTWKISGELVEIFSQLLGATRQSQMPKINADIIQASGSDRGEL